MITGRHPSHVTRFSDASTFDEICVNCGATDEVPGGWGQLAYPCPTFDLYQNIGTVELRTLRAAFVLDAEAGANPAFVRGRLAVIDQVLSARGEAER